MAPASKLLALYVATYGQPPSSHSLAAIVRMEELFGLEQDDPFARMMIVLLNSADRFDAAVGQRTEKERAFVDGLGELMRRLTYLIGRVDAAGSKAARKATAVRRLADEDLIPVARSVSPLFAYLRLAFRRKSGAFDEDERIDASRRDLFGAGALIGAALVLAVYAGCLIG